MGVSRRRDWSYCIAMVLCVAVAVVLYCTGRSQTLGRALAFVAQNARPHDLAILDLSARGRAVDLPIPAVVTKTPSAVAVWQHQGVWLLQYGARKDWKTTIGSFPFACQGPWRFGNFALHFCPNPAPRPVAMSLMEELDKARVVLERKGRQRRCRFDRNRRCSFPPHAWCYVGPEQLTFLGRPRRCIFAHPDSGAVLHITFPSVSLTGGMQLAYGFPDSAHHPANASLQLEVAVADQVVVQERVAHEKSWHTVQVEPISNPPRGALRLSIWSEDTGAKHFCFTGIVYR